MIYALKKKGSPFIENSILSCIYLVPPMNEDGIYNSFRKEAIISSRYALDAIIK